MAPAISRVKTGKTTIRMLGFIAVLAAIEN
jgi:hypothetical protein